MTHTITKDIYTIKYNITDTILTIGITNKDTLRKYSSIKTSDEYCIYSGLGINIFDIVDKLFAKGTFNITDTTDNIIIEFAIGSIKIPIQCEANTYSKEEVEDSELRSVINAMRKTLDTTVRELSDYKKTLDITVKQLNQHANYINDVVNPFITNATTDKISVQGQRGDRSTPAMQHKDIKICNICGSTDTTISNSCPNCFRVVNRVIPTLTSLTLLAQAMAIRQTEYDC